MYMYTWIFQLCQIYVCFIYKASQVRQKFCIWQSWKIQVHYTVLYPYNNLS